MISTLRESRLIIPIEGDASSPDNLGITSPETIQTLQDTVSVILNLASKIRVLATLSEIKQTNIDSAFFVADFALKCSKLERFVWASSAYSNSHLHMQHDGTTITTVAEEIYPDDIAYSPHTTPAPELTPEQLAQTEEEYQSISETGTNSNYLSGKFMTSYTYAKHLTERLMLSRYRSKLPHLMIFRPTCIGPALFEPFPRYELLGSNPVTSIMSYSLSLPNETMELPTNNPKDGFSSLIDEIPVDLCMNQLIAHTSAGTTGPVHAGVGAENCLTFGDYWREYLSSVPFSQRPNLKWIDDSILRTPEGQAGLVMLPLLRLFSYTGASFDFVLGKTKRVWAGMGQKEREILPLMVDGREELEWALRLRKKRTGAAIVAEFKGSNFFTSGKETEKDPIELSVEHVGHGFV